MVFFVCDACNETVKKNAVEKHCRRCRDCWSLSCVDCSVSFEGDEYKKHTSCISEAQKYQGALYQGKKKSGKVTQQERWMEAVHSLMDVNSTFSAEAKSVAERLSEYDNCPRKKKKFTNFLKNSFRVREAVIEEIFVALEKAVEMKRVADEGASEAKKKADALPPTSKDDNESKSRSSSSSSSSSSSNDNNNTEQPDAKRGDKWWRKKVRAALRAEPERKMNMKKLRRLIVKQFRAEHGEEENSKKECKRKFKEIISSGERFESQGDDVVLVKSDSNKKRKR